jgi:hypothetical protein
LAGQLVRADRAARRLRVGFANSDGVVFVDESAEKIATT